MPGFRAHTGRPGLGAFPSFRFATFSEALKPVLRSKGFCWVDSEPFRAGAFRCASRNINPLLSNDFRVCEVNEWSHAGRSLSVLPKAGWQLLSLRRAIALQIQDWWWSVLKPDQLHFQVSPASQLEPRSVGSASIGSQATLAPRASSNELEGTNGRYVWHMWPWGRI